jgi:hypothetical protein
MVTITLEIDTSNFKTPLQNCVNILLIRYFKGINELKWCSCDPWRICYIGSKIGYSGNTGFSSLAHLHFAIIKPGLLTSVNHCPLFLNNSQG